MTDWLGAFLDGVFNGNSAKTLKHVPGYQSAKEKADHKAKNAFYKSVDKKTSTTKASSKSSSKSKSSSSSKSKSSSSSKSGSGSSGSSSGSNSGSGDGKTTSNAVIEDVTANAIKSQNLKPVVNNANKNKPFWNNEGMETDYLSGDIPNFRIFISHQKYNAFGDETVSPEDSSLPEKEVSE